MATIKVKLRPSSVVERAGTIYYQVTHRRATQQITTNIRLQPDEWDTISVYNSFIAEPRIEVVGVSNEPQQTIVPTSTQVEPNISNDQTVNVDSLESTQSATQEQ